MHKHHHTDEKGRHSPARSKIAKMFRGHTSPKERGGPARKPGNPGPNGNGMKEKRIGMMEKIREREPQIGMKGHAEDLEKTGMYRKAYAKGVKKLIRETRIR